MADLPSPYSVTPRKPLTDRQRLELFLSENGRCCICGLPIRAASEAWDEHILPLADNGSNEIGNRGVAHEKCARSKSAKEAKERAHLRRAAERHFGAKRPKKIMPGSRRSPWKKKADGSWVRRDQEKSDC